MIGVVVIGAIALVVATVATVKALRARPRPSAPEPARLVGALGTVVTHIPDDGTGEVTVTTDGQRLKLEATADNPISTGATVVVVDAESDAVVVAESGF